MSSKSKDGLVRLQSVSGPMEMRLLNHRFEAVAQGYGSIEQKVPAGLYRLDIIAGPTQQSEYLTVKPGETFENLKIQVSFPSSTPIPDTSTFNSAHAKAASRLSLKPTRRFGQGGRLVIFFRNVHSEQNLPIELSGFALHNAAFETVSDQAKDITRNERLGWAAFAADVDPGGYILRNAKRLRNSWSSETMHEESVDLSIWVAKGWTTLLFVPNWEGRKFPSLTRTSIYMTRLDKGFFSGPRHSSAQELGIDLALELALSGLRTGRPVVSADLLHLALQKKSENPMLGIVGAHALLLDPNPQWTHFDTVCRSLRKLLPEHPDVTSLYVMGKELRDKSASSAVKPVSWPPMLYRGYRGLIARDATEPGLIEDGSPADRIASYLRPEGPWTMWQSMGTNVIRSARNLSQANIDSLKKASANLIDGDLTYLRKDSQKTASQSAGELLDPEVFRVAECVGEIAQRAVPSKKSQATRSLGVEDVSKIVGLPVSSVRRAIRTISEKNVSDLEA